MANRFAVPARFGIRRMRNIHIDSPYLRIRFLDDGYLFGRLEKEDRAHTGINVKAGNAARPAARIRGEGNLSGKHLFVWLFHPFGGPGLQNRIAEIRDPVTHAPLAVWNVRM